MPSCNTYHLTWVSLTFYVGFLFMAAPAKGSTYGQLIYDGGGKNTEVVCHSLLQWTTFCQTSPPRPDHVGWPHMAWLSFIELDKAVVRVIRLTSFL